ncbi:MAG: putative bifunctional diguanylate cyclase/phosphodiesterase [Actinomycetales bacterium]
MSARAGAGAGWLLPLSSILVAGLIAMFGLSGHDVSAYLAAGFLVPQLIHAFLLMRRAEGEHAIHLHRAAYALLAVAVALILPCFDVLSSPKERAWTLLVVGAVSLATSSATMVIRFGRMVDRLLFRQAILESIQMSAVSIALLWEWIFVKIDHPDDVSQNLILAVVIVVSILGALIFQSGTREPEPHFMWLILAALPVLFCALFDMYTALTGFPRWTANLLTTLAFTVLIWQVRRSATAESPLAMPGEAETRRVTAVAGLTGLLTLVAIASLTLDGSVEPITWVCIVVYIVSLSARDVLQTVRSRRLTNDLRFQALHDPLTGLPNRRSLDEWIGEQGVVQPVSVVTLDLDHFKDVNDLLGHTTGDKLLKQVAVALRTTIEGTGSEAFRMGGDEFTVVVPGSPEQAEATAARLMHAIDDATTKVTGVSRLNVGASVGVRHLPPPRTPNNLRAALGQAGQAMRLAKTSGKHRVQVFDDSLHREYHRTKHIEVRLREHVSDVDVHYQPIWDIHSGQVAGLEALARWTDPEFGVVEPGEFIAVAEQVGLIDDLGMSILKRAIAQAIGEDLLGTERVLHVNVSALQLRVPDFPDQVFALLARHGLPRHQLVLELTESISVKADGAVAIAMARLVEGGVRIAVDDFGAGSTSVSYLTKLPVSAVKIDRSLTRDMHEPATAGIIRGVLEMCRGLKLDVVIEGVETVEQERMAEEIGLILVQGRLFGGPVPAQELARSICEGERILDRVPTQREAKL